MKSKLKLFIIYFIFIQLIFSIKSISIASNNNSNYTTEQIAIREIIDAYYRKSINAQYCSDRFERLASPEEATSQNTLYSDCSNFTYMVYNQLFGANPYGINSTVILPYGKKFYDSNNIQTNDVIEYWEKTTDANENKIYCDNEGNIKNIDLSTDSGRQAYATILLTQYNLQVGDILCWHWESGNTHIVLVYDILYNENHEPINALIRECGDKKETKTIKLKKGLNFANVLNENTNINEGGFIERYLVNNYKTSSNVTKRPVLYSISMASQFTILRPLLKDENGNYTNQFYNPICSGGVCTGRTLKNYTLKSEALNRITYSKIDIEKTVDVFNGSAVKLGDTLEYTIRITNNSDTNYQSFDVIENLSNNTELLNNGNGNIEENKIIWNIQSLTAKQSIELKYKVKVKESSEYLGEEIVSTGTVAGIPSSTVKNTIYNSLDENSKLNIKNKAQTVINSGENFGQELVSKIYNEALGVDLNLDTLNISDLIKVRNGTTYYPENSTATPTIYLNKENEFSKMVINNYYRRRIHR